MPQKRAVLNIAAVESANPAAGRKRAVSINKESASEKDSSSLASKKRRKEGVAESPVQKTCTFDAEYLDHFETPEVAYIDLKSILDFHIKQTHNCAIVQDGDVVTVYDPYFCQGRAKKFLENVMNEQVDECVDNTKKQKKGARTPLDEDADAKSVAKKGVSIKDEGGKHSGEKRKYERITKAKVPIPTKLKVINENRDFYADIADGEIPEYDILVTNPPYSGDHKQRLLEYLFKDITGSDQTSSTGGGGSNESKTGSHPASCTASSAVRPFCLLLPSWTVSKKFFREFLFRLGNVKAREKLERKRLKEQKKLARSGTSDATSDAAEAKDEMKEAATESSPFVDSPTLERAAEVFYIVPKEKYTFIHPELPTEQKAKGKSLAPFYGIWVCGNFRNYEGYVDKFAPKKICLSLEDLQQKNLARTAEDVKRRQELNPKQKWRKEKYGAAAGRGRDRGPPGRREAGAASRGDDDSGAHKRQKKLEHRKVVRKSDVAEDATAEAPVSKAVGRGAGKEVDVKAGGDVDKGVCRHFLSAQGCNRGSNCRFRHE